MILLKRLSPSADVLLLRRPIIKDARGWFMEAYNYRAFMNETGASIAWVQDSRFYSKKGILRGPHVMTRERSQYKLVESLRGRLFVTAICVRGGSPECGKAYSAELTVANRKMMLIPPGWATAILALTDAVGQYKTNVHFTDGPQLSLAWDDPTVNVQWPIKPIVRPSEPFLPLEEVAARV